MIRRSAVVLAFLLAALLPTSAAYASVSTADRLAVLADWTQPTAASTAAWNAARLDRGPWEQYRFDWSTDYCSGGPDNPFGFAFAIPCWHHDFGYRNYKADGQFKANKARVDSMFYADLKRTCHEYPQLERPACNAVAWLYYQAVRVFGSLAALDDVALRNAYEQNAYQRNV